MFNGKMGGMNMKWKVKSRLGNSHKAILNT